MKELVKKSAREINQLFLKKEIKAKEIVESFLGYIKEVEPKVQALNAVTQELAYKQAQKLDELIQRNEKFTPISAVPIIVKDVICVKDYPATCGSKILEKFIAPYESTATKKLWDAGAICLAKSNMDEFAMGSSTENSAYKITKNPWNLNKVPGGSSGGSAAAVSAFESPISLGTDTGGSVRQPASFCGVVGLKPTYGRISRFGLIAFASSLDQIGTFSRNVYDTALLLQVMSGYDPQDSTSLSVELPDYLAKIDKGIKGKKIGLVRELIGDGIDAEVKKAIEQSVEIFKQLGAEIVEISLPNIKYALPVYYIVATAEASANLARYDGVKYGHRAPGNEILSMYTKTREEGFGAEVKRRIMLGTFALSSGYYDAYYKKAQQVRKLVTQDFLNHFEKIDLMISPTCPTTAFDIGSKVQDPLSMYLSDIATIPASLAGLPAISIPCASDSKGLPVGLQIIAPALGEELLLEAAFAFEKACKFDSNKIPAGVL